MGKRLRCLTHKTELDDLAAHGDSLALQPSLHQRGQLLDNQQRDLLRTVILKRLVEVSSLLRAEDGSNMLSQWFELVAGLLTAGKVIDLSANGGNELEMVRISCGLVEAIGSGLASQLVLDGDRDVGPLNAIVNAARAVQQVGLGGTCVSMLDQTIQGWGLLLGESRWVEGRCTDSYPVLCS